MQRDGGVHDGQAVQGVGVGAEPGGEGDDDEGLEEAIDGDVEQRSREGGGEEEHLARVGGADGPGGEELDGVKGAKGRSRRSRM